MEFRRTFRVETCRHLVLLQVVPHGGPLGRHVPLHADEVEADVDVAVGEALVHQGDLGLDLCVEVDKPCIINTV